MRNNPPSNTDFGTCEGLLAESKKSGNEMEMGGEGGNDPDDEVLF